MCSLTRSPRVRMLLSLRAPLFLLPTAPADPRREKESLGGALPSPAHAPRRARPRSVGSVIFYALGLSFLLVALHGCLHVPDDLFMDEPQARRGHCGRKFPVRGEVSVQGERLPFGGRDWRPGGGGLQQLCFWAGRGTGAAMVGWGRDVHSRLARPFGGEGLRRGSGPTVASPSRGRHAPLLPACAVELPEAARLRPRRPALLSLQAAPGGFLSLLTGGGAVAATTGANNV